jgi:hypothetical protein
MDQRQRDEGSRSADAGQRLKELAVSDSGFVFDPCSGGTFSVNATGLAILGALKEERGPAEIIAVLEQSFEVVGQRDLRRDLDEFVHLLRQNGLVPHDFIW